MAKPELGTKRICPETGRKFYDLNRNPIVSPYTGTSYPLSYFETPSRTAKRVAAAAVVEEEEEVEVVEVADEEAPETISLVEVEEDEEVAAKDEVVDIDDDEEVEVDDADDTFLEADEDEEDDMTDIIGSRDDDDD